jgi:hypothetical protein
MRSSRLSKPLPAVLSRPSRSWTRGGDSPWFRLGTTGSFPLCWRLVAPSVAWLSTSRRPAQIPKNRVSGVRTAARNSLVVHGVCLHVHVFPRTCVPVRKAVAIGPARQRARVGDPRRSSCRSPSDPVSVANGGRNSTIVETPKARGFSMRRERQSTCSCRQCLSMAASPADRRMATQHRTSSRPTTRRRSEPT